MTNADAFLQAEAMRGVTSGMSCWSSCAPMKVGPSSARARSRISCGVSKSSKSAAMAKGHGWIGEGMTCSVGVGTSLRTQASRGCGCGDRSGARADVSGRSSQQGERVGRLKFLREPTGALLRRQISRGWVRCAFARLRSSGGRGGRHRACGLRVPDAEEGGRAVQPASCPARFTLKPRSTIARCGGTLAL